MDALEFTKEVIHFGATLIGAVVSGLALAAWNGWRKDQEAIGKDIQELKTNHILLARDVARHREDIDGLKQDHRKLDGQMQHHGQEHVRLTTMLEQMFGPRKHHHHPREGQSPESA